MCRYAFPVCVLQALEEKERRQLTEREMLHRDRLNLQQKMTELTNGYRVRVGRSVSECSSSLSSSSTSSGSPASLAESYESGESRHSRVYLPLSIFLRYLHISLSVRPSEPNL